MEYSRPLYEYLCPVVSFLLLLLLLLLLIFPRLISAAADWMSTILPHMMWPWHWSILTLCGSSSKIKAVEQSSRLSQGEKYPIDSNVKMELGKPVNGAVFGKCRRQRHHEDFSLICMRSTKHCWCTLGFIQTPAQSLCYNSFLLRSTKHCYGCSILPPKLHW